MLITGVQTAMASYGSTTVQSNLESGATNFRLQRMFVGIPFNQTLNAASWVDPNVNSIYPIAQHINTVGNINADKPTTVFSVENMNYPVHTLNFNLQGSGFACEFKSKRFRIFPRVLSHFLFSFL